MNARNRKTRYGLAWHCCGTKKKEKHSSTTAKKDKSVSIAVDSQKPSPTSTATTAITKTTRKRRASTHPPACLPAAPSLIFPCHRHGTYGVSRIKKRHPQNTDVKKNKQCFFPPKPPPPRTSNAPTAPPSHLKLTRERLGSESVRALRRPQLGTGKLVEHEQEGLHHPAHASDQQDREVQERLPSGKTQQGAVRVWNVGRGGAGDVRSGQNSY